MTLPKLLVLEPNTRNHPTITNRFKNEFDIKLTTTLKEADTFLSQCFADEEKIMFVAATFEETCHSAVVAAFRQILQKKPFTVDRGTRAPFNFLTKAHQCGAETLYVCENLEDFRVDRLKARTDLEVINLRPHGSRMKVKIVYVGPDPEVKVLAV